MYRVANQFDPASCQDDMSAAGGGSTSTTCSSCVVTLAAASIVTAIIFSRNAPGDDEEAADIAAAPGIAGAASVAADAGTAGNTGIADAIDAVDAAGNAGAKQSIYTVDTIDAAGSGNPQPPAANPEPPIHIAAPDDMTPPLSFAARTILGLGSFILAIGVGLLGAQFVQPVFGFILFCGTYIGLFCWVYERSRRSAKRGALIAILILAVGLAVGAFEMYMWLQYM